MFRKAVAFFAIISVSGPCFAGGLILETLYGFGSIHAPFTSGWPGSFEGEDLIYREYAARATYRPQGIFSYSLGLGGFEAIRHPGASPDNETPPPPEWPSFSSEESADAFYTVPKVRLNLRPVRLDAGLLLFHMAEGTRLDQPFDRKNGVIPSAGIELGEEDTYMFIGLFNGFTLMHQRVIEIGLAMRLSSAFTQQIFFAESLSSIDIGCRLELSARKTLAIVLGASVGWVETGHDDNQYGINIGTKVLL